MRKIQTRQQQQQQQQINRSTKYRGAKLIDRISIVPKNRKNEKKKNILVIIMVTFRNDLLLDDCLEILLVMDLLSLDRGDE